MSPIVMVVLWILMVIIGHGLPILVRWLQLRWQMQQEHTYRRDLVAIARALPVGGRIVEEHSDGTWRRLDVACGRVEYGDDG